MPFLLRRPSLGGASWLRSVLRLAASGLQPTRSTAPHETISQRRLQSTLGHSPHPQAHPCPLQRITPSRLRTIARYTGHHLPDSRGLAGRYQSTPHSLHTRFALWDFRSLQGDATYQVWESADARAGRDVHRNVNRVGAVADDAVEGGGCVGQTRQLIRWRRPSITVSGIQRGGGPVQRGHVSEQAE